MNPIFKHIINNIPISPSLMWNYHTSIHMTGEFTGVSAEELKLHKRLDTFLIIILVPTEQIIICKTPEFTLGRWGLGDPNFLHEIQKHLEKYKEE